MALRRFTPACLAVMLYLALVSMPVCSSAEPAASHVRGVISTANARADTSDRMAWFSDARFGMFIHWSPVCLTGEEIGWSRQTVTPHEEYDRLYLRFDPTQFDADAIAQLAVDAGMKYVVFTAKHHDGFCMWDSELTDYDIMSTPFGRDVTAELAAACRARGLHFCLYYSILDWYHPHYHPQNLSFGGAGESLPAGVEPDMDIYIAYMEAQLEELITRYEPELIWFDGAWEGAWTQERGDALDAFVRELAPDILINNRAGKGDHATVLAVGDYLTPEQKLGTFNNETPWETCMTIGTQWAWKPNDNIKSLTQCLHSLISCAAGDGNLLFNVGPTERGEVEERQAQRLREMGDWLEIYGQTIYHTCGGPWRPGAWGGSTYAGDTIYLHILNWPEGDLVLPAYGQQITDVRMFSGDGQVEWTQEENGRLRIRVRAEHRDAIDTVIALTVEAPVDQMAQPGGALSIFESDSRFGEIVSRDATFKTSSTAHWDNPDHHALLLDGSDQNPEFAFHTLEERNPWLVIDLGEEIEVTGLWIENRRGFEALSAGMTISTSLDGEDWRQVWQAEDVARNWTVPITRPQAGIEVPGQTARYLRLSVEHDEPAYFHLRRVEVWGRRAE